MALFPPVINSYSIHYTKLYDGSEINRIYNLFQGFNVSFVASHNPYTVVFNNTTGKVELSQEYKYIDTKTYVSKPGSILPDRSIPTVYQAAYNPFEPVTITFAKNYPSLGYDAGYTAVVPAYYAILLNRSIESKNIDDNVRRITSYNVCYTKLLRVPGCNCKNKRRQIIRQEK